ncbi:dTMP kinase [Paeniroseomonas aquatica]|uniref:Thymidylate kinase n=1 Tax=Paeniroseomonas aquatica TaxID=373043 RepID=A0ABT8A3K2_9PROT|nr:dTMP kinase [Paeniroseomonas aquatica]MDN3564368.1 dTMP kinase [Paeniroseomonas aquatica]
MVSDLQITGEYPANYHGNVSKMHSHRVFPGFFAVVEGVDGSGKTSALAHLKKVLEVEYPDLILTREPGGTPEGNAIRGLVVSSGTLNWDPTAELLVMAAARAQHVAAVIRPALEAGRVVLCDRFVGSTIAYQGAGRGLDVNSIREIHKLTTGDLQPDLTLVLDVDPEVALKRSHARLSGSGVNEGRFEALELGFHQRVRESFLAQASANPERYAVIDGHRDVLEIWNDLNQILSSALACAKSR